MFRLERLFFGLIVGLLCCVGTSGVSALSISELEIVVNPSGHAPLAAVCRFLTDDAAVAEIVISDGLREQRVPVSAAATRRHEIVLLGFTPDTRHLVYVAATDASGARAEAAAIEVVTGPLPKQFPPVHVVTSSPDEMEPGVTLVPTIRWPLSGPDDSPGLAFILDHSGRVVWYYTPDHGVTEIRRAANGNFLYQSGRLGHMYEIDVLGNMVRQWHSSGTPKDVAAESIPVATDSFHHDFFEMPNEHLLQLSTEVREFADWPSSDTKADAAPKTAMVIGDVLVEHTRDTGAIVREWKIFDVLDPYRIGYGSMGTGFYKQTYEGVLDKPARDWAHTNAVFYVPGEDATVFSSYNQDLIYKIDLGTGKLHWLLGDPGGWGEDWKPYLLAPKGGMRWQYHQHAVKVTPQGTILLYDNGTNGARPFNAKKSAKELYSRAVEYRVDEDAMTVEEVWSYGGAKDEIFFSSFICDVDWMPKTGNVLITDGGRTRKRDGSDEPAGFNGQHWARILEVTHTTPSRKLFEVEFKADPPEGWAVYRSERLPSLYP